MTIKQLQTALKKNDLWQPCHAKAKKCELQQQLKHWIRTNSENAADQNDGSHCAPSQCVYPVWTSTKLEKPSAMALDNHGFMLIADMKTKTINVCEIIINGVSVNITVKQTINSVPLVYSLAVDNTCMYIASCDPDNGGIFSCVPDNTGRWGDTLLPLLKNKTEQCSQVRAVANHPDGLVFTDTGSHQVKLFTKGEVKVSVGTGVSGHTDGSRGQFCQVTSICTELNTIFVADSAVGRICMITKSEALLTFLENLNKFASVLGLHKKGTKCKQFSIEETIATLSSVHVFLLHCEDKVKLHSGKSKPQGPEGACSQQCLSDISLIIGGLHQVRRHVQELNPELEAKFHIMSALTLVVENLFSHMREGNDMPLVLQFAHRFSACTREFLKQLCQCHFHYFSSNKSYYQRSSIEVSYKKLPTMSLPPRVKKSISEMDSLHNWRVEFGQSVRQVTVRNLSTKDKPGTLPINIYALQLPKPKLVDFTDVTNQNESSDVEASNLADNIFIKSGSFVYLKRCPFRLTLLKLTENIFDDSTQPCKAVSYVSDIIEATQFNKAGNCEITRENIAGCLNHNLLEESQDKLYLGEDLLAELIHTCKDQGDTVSMDEEQESVEITTETVTRSGRVSKRARDMDYLHYN